MITYVERVCFSPRHMAILARVEVYVARVSKAWGNELRCHEIARAVHLVIDMHKLIVVDGKCGPIEHSWLCFAEGVILDPYVPGRMPPVQLIDPIVGVAYRHGSPRTDIRCAIVDRLVLEMRGEDSVT